MLSPSFVKLTLMVSSVQSAFTEMKVEEYFTALIIRLLSILSRAAESAETTALPIPVSKLRDRFSLRAVSEKLKIRDLSLSTRSMSSHFRAKPIFSILT